MKFRGLSAFLALSAALSACVSGTDSTPASAGPTSGFQAQFNPDFGVMPFPNDLYFSGSKTGQLNIPGDAKVAANGPLLELNHLDGYGTQSDISVYFTSDIDKASINPSDVVVLKVASSPTTKAVDVTVTPKLLVQGTDYKAEVSPGSDVGSSILTIKPLHPLAASTITGGTTPVPATYLVIVTAGLKDTSGASATPSADFAKVLAADLPVLKGGKMGSTGDATLDQVALFTLPQLAVAAGVGLDPTKIAVSFSFSTEYLGIALGAVAATAAPTTQPTGVGIIDTGETVCQVLVASKQIPSAAACATADPGSTITEVFAGTVALPYYLKVPAKGTTTALTDSWHNAAGTDIALNATDPTSFIPKATVAQNVIPVLVALPTTTSGCPAMPVTGWPVVIFQHGITRNREDMLAAAAALSVGGITHGLCAAVIAIDLPLHGVTNTADPFYTKGFERTFDMDANGAAGATGSAIAGSGSFFINLNSTITSRDNLREGAADLLNLVATLPNLHPASIPPLTPAVYGFDSTKVFFVGHSLGGIVGTTFLGADTEGAIATSSLPKVTSAVLAMPGGHLAELLRLSPAFGPVIDKGLAQQGIVKGTQSYYDFYSQAQAVVEDGDPANYAALATGGAVIGAPASLGHPIHVIEVVGGHDSSSPPDKVVPNSATDVLIGEMGIKSTVSTVGLNPVAGGSPTLAQFTTGDHSSILSPAAPSPASATVQADYAAVTAEMQAEAASMVFDFLGGVPAVTVTSSTFLSPNLKK